MDIAHWKKQEDGSRTCNTRPSGIQSCPWRAGDDDGEKVNITQMTIIEASATAVQYVVSNGITLTSSWAWLPGGVASRRSFDHHRVWKSVHWRVMLRSSLTSQMLLKKAFDLTQRPGFAQKSITATAATRRPGAGAEQAFSAKSTM